MGWENRERGGPYYVQKERVGGRVVSRYIGNGETAMLIAEWDRIEKSKAQNERDWFQYLRKEAEAQEAELTAFYEAVEVEMRQALEGAGFHQHKGGWRKRRGKRDGEDAGETG